jgi:hypothetical protein
VESREKRNGKELKSKSILEEQRKAEASVKERAKQTKPMRV